jgi:acetyltransferase-like isoleucine patch superfamily enzyme
MNLLPLWAFIIRVRNKLFSLSIKGAFFSCGRNAVIEMPCRLDDCSKIAIGANTFIGADSWLAVIPQNETKQLPQFTAPVISIGSNTGITGHCTISAVRQIVIEEEVLIARYVYISDHTHEYSDKSIAIKYQGVTKISPVVIKKGTWIGQGAVICPGVTLGENCVVAANSVVRHSFPSHSVIAGSPAKLIKRID